MNLLQEYLHELHEIRSSGSAVKETSYYPAISNLLNGVGKALKPRVRCIINIKNRGAGIPDGGLFTPDQFQSRSEEELAEGTIPARGVIEIKPTSEDAWVVADGLQVTRYWGKYRQVLVTNYRDFVTRRPGHRRKTHEARNLPACDRLGLLGRENRTESNGASAGESGTVEI